MNPRILLSTPYHLSRLPLTVLDQRVVARWRDDCTPRLLFDRAVGTYDYLAGRLIADPDVTRRGSDRMAHAVALSEAAERADDLAELSAAPRAPRTRS